MLQCNGNNEQKMAEAASHLAPACLVAGSGSPHRFHADHDNVGISSVESLLRELCPRIVCLGGTLPAIPPSQCPRCRMNQTCNTVACPTLNCTEPIRANLSTECCDHCPNHPVLTTLALTTTTTTQS
ncbi:unnamed protein product [Didymodactylos carnosus]|uniref:Uncharacterized protein n=1 Tax=Didymodactylos carnosus TaxID=1234261 RepID=A0A815EWX4_9BILA|nr:unnamed protein product [Didymodactylos carnosus]CAF4157289.1 unnamed protein product [Didymodactylos carnosus]